MKSERGTGSRHMHCRLAAGPPPGFTQEVAHLLRTRLRLAVLILLAAFTLHFVRNLLLRSDLEERTAWLVFGGCEVVVMALASALLWGRRALSLGALRALELAVFAAGAAFFAWLQVDTFSPGPLLRALLPGHEVLVFRLVGLPAAFGWFLLIVLYGVFIPNTWRRCAAVAAGLALIPVALTVAEALFDPAARPYVLSALPGTVVALATAVAVAVLGSHRIRELHRKAHEAECLGQYRLKDVLGFGGMGTVYLAEHVLLRRPCAVKVIRPDQAGDPGTLRRFEREVRATATLTHWNTIEVFDYGHAEDGTFYYVMEYLPGLNLQDMVEGHGPLPPARAVHLLRQVCGALREAHAIGLLHRDIKPSNIIACERGRVYDVAKLVDFGLVKSVGLGGDSVQLTRHGALTGTPAFLSPEQAQGREQLDARSDLYGLGAVAHFLVTGKLPFDRPSALAMIHAHGYEPFEPCPEFKESVPADLQEVIARCLQKEPGLRYPDAAALEKALAACEGVAPWTAEQAEEWWRRQGGAAAPPPAQGPHPEEQPTVAAGARSPE